MAAEDTFRKWRPLAWKIAGGILRKLPRSVQREDIFAAADMGLWQGSLRLQAGLTTGFEHYYLSKRVRGSIMDELRRQDWAPRRGRSEKKAPEIVYSDELVEAFSVPAFEPDFLEAAKRALAMSELEQRDRFVLARHLEGAKQIEIATELGVSEPRVSQLMSRIRKKLAIRMRRAA